VRTLRNAGQFAYLGGVSTDTAIHQLVCRIERSVKQAEFCVGIFLDIEAAISHATFHSMDKAMEAFDVSRVCHLWVKNMLTSRVAIAELQETKVSRVVERGCPQGGVVSPLLWNLVVHELLVILTTEFPELYTQGYADDISNLAVGYDLPTVRALFQRVLRRVLEWCHKVDLGINPDKIVAVLFTRNRKYNFKPLMLEG